jgi:hypothetical protein
MPIRAKESMVNPCGRYYMRAPYYTRVFLANQVDQGSNVLVALEGWMSFPKNVTCDPEWGYVKVKN